MEKWYKESIMAQMQVVGGTVCDAIQGEVVRNMLSITWVKG
jgi:hypothetical protein